VKAYVLIQAQPGGVPLAERLRGLPEIVWAEDVSGPYDAIALAQSGPVFPIDDLIAAIYLLPRVTRAVPARVVEGEP
jgi:hypothetical protein